MASLAPVAARLLPRVLSATLLALATLTSAAPATAQEYLDPVGSWGGDRRVSRLAADGDRVVLGTGANLLVGTVDSGGRIVEGGSLALPVESRGLDVSGGLAAVPLSGARVWLVDVSDPTRPREVASLPVPASTRACRVFFDRPRALVAGEDMDLHVVDLSDPDLPLVRTAPIRGLPVGAWDGHLFVGPQPLEVWDIDRSSPVATLETEGDVGSAAVSGGWVFAPHVESIFWGLNWWGSPVYTYVPRLSAARLGREPEGALAGSTVSFGQSVRFPPWLAPDGEHLVIMGSDLGLAVVEVGACDTLPPEARFEWWPSLPAPGLPVHFRDLSLGLPSTVRWSFPDGTTSDEPSPVHLFATPGRYPVTLEVANHVGTDTVTMEVVVGGVRGARGRFGRP